MELTIKNNKIKILVVDDEPTNRFIIKNFLLKEGYSILEATNGIEAIKTAKENIPDLILMDALMPKMDGFEAIQEIKKNKELEDIPVLMVTALLDKDDKVKAFESGANDFITKPVDKEELLLRVKSFVRMRYLHLQNLKARIDTNYHIPNLQALQDKLEYLKKPVGIFFQIKDFENILYLYGVNGTNIIINDMIAKVKKYCNIIDNNIYSISEDRFTIVWEGKDNCNEEQILKHSKKLQKFINSGVFGKKPYISDLKCSIALNNIKDDFIKIGVLVLREAIKKNIPYLIVNDIYKEMLENIENTQKMILCIDKAIKEDRIIPVYQPIMDAKTNQLLKYECLVRLRKEDGSLLSPYFFLDIAKQSDQYYDITKIMINKTFEYMKDKNYEFSINLSSIDIENPDILHFLFDKLEEYNVYDRLIIELLEDETIKNFNEVLIFIKQIKQMGVRVAIDDYGSGYSNLERIFQFQPDFIKIDGSIIKGIVEDSTKLAIAKSAVYLAKEIGIKAVGEFVSDEKICKKCKEIGIDFLQGYYIDAPQEVTSNQLIFQPH